MLIYIYFLWEKFYENIFLSVGNFTLHGTLYQYILSKVHPELQALGILPWIFDTRIEKNRIQ